MRLRSIFWSGSEEKSSGRSKNLIARKESDWIADVPTRLNTAVESRYSHEYSQRGDNDEIREGNTDFPAVYVGPYEDMMACSGSVGESFTETKQQQRVIKVNPQQNDNDNEPHGCLVDFVLNEQSLIDEVIHKNAVVLEKSCRDESDELDVSGDRKGFDPLSIPIPMKSLVLGDKYTYNDYANFASRGIDEMKTVLQRNAFKDYASSFNEMKTVLRRNDCNGNELIDILADWDGGETFTYDSSISDSLDKVMRDPLHSIDSGDYTIESDLSGMSQFGSLPLLSSSNGSTSSDAQNHQDEVEVTLSGIKPCWGNGDEIEDCQEITLATTSSSIGFQDQIEVSVSGIKNDDETAKEIKPHCITAIESSCSSNSFLGVVDASHIITTQKMEPEVEGSTIDSSTSTLDSVCSVTTEALGAKCAEEKSSDTGMEDKPKRIEVLRSFFRTVKEKRARATKPRSSRVEDEPMKSNVQEVVILKKSDSIVPIAGATLDASFTKKNVKGDVILEDSAKRIESTAGANDALLKSYLHEEPTTDAIIDISHNKLEEPTETVPEFATIERAAPEEEQVQLESEVLESGSQKSRGGVDIHVVVKTPEQPESLDSNYIEMSKNSAEYQSDEAEVEHADQVELIQPNVSVAPAEAPKELVKQDLTDQSDNNSNLNTSQHSSNASNGCVAEAESVIELTNDKSSEINKSSDDETYVCTTESTETECSIIRAERIELAQNLDWSAFVQEGLKSRSVGSSPRQSPLNISSHSASPNTSPFSPPPNKSESFMSSQSDNIVPTKISLVKSFFGKVRKKNHLKKVSSDGRMKRVSFVSRLAKS